MQENLPHQWFTNCHYCSYPVLFVILHVLFALEFVIICGFFNRSIISESQTDEAFVISYTCIVMT